MISICFSPLAANAPNDFACTLETSDPLNRGYTSGSDSDP